MTIKQLIEETKPLKVVGNDNIEVTGIEIDSRRIGPGNAFIAMKGTQVDGHQFIPKALEQGRKRVLPSFNTKVPRALLEHWPRTSMVTQQSG